jgi:ligand-binding sensor domain-containing protein
MNKKLLFIFLFLMIYLFSYGQEGDYTIKQYTKEDGLPSNTVYGVTQDKDGFIWFCTDAGVCKFDGIRFKIFTKDDGLPSNEVFELFCDSKNRIWIRSFSAKLCFIKNDKIFSAENCDYLKLVKNNGQSDVFEDAKQNIWFIFFDRDPDSLKIVLIDSNNNTSTIRKKLKAGYCYQYNDSILIMGSKNTSFIHLKSNYSRLESYINFNNLHGLIIEKNEIFFTTHKNKFGFGKTAEIFLKGYSIISPSINLFKVDSNFWVSTNKGINIYHRYDTHLINSILSNFQTNHVFQDKKKYVWVGTTNQGLIKLIPKVRSNNMLHNQSVMSILKDKHNIYLGMKTENIQIFNQNNSQIEEVSYLPKSNVVYGIRKIIKYNNEIQFLSNQYIHFLKNGNFFNVVTAGSNKCIHQIGNEIYVSYDYMLFILNPQSKKSTTILPRLFKNIYAIAKYQNQLIIGTQDSLYTVANFQRIPYNLNIPFDYRANDLIVKDSLLIASTIEKGIFFIDRHKVVKNLNVKNGLSTNTTYKSFVYKDKLYTTSNKGINIYDFKTEKISHVFESDGLASNMVFDLAIDNDTVYAATESGLSIIPISTIKQDRTFPLFIKPIYKTNDTTWEIPKTFVTHTDTPMTIVLNSLSFETKGEVNYFYRIKELDTNFKSSIDQNLNFVFNNHGNYTFESYAINTNGTQSNFSNLRIYVKPYFYQTAVFRMVLGLLTLASILLLIYYLMNRAKRKAEEQTALETKIRNLEISAWKSAINPHFLFNSLNTMQGLFHQNDFKKANNYVAEFSSILRKTIDHSGRLLIRLDAEIAYLKNYLELEKIKRTDKFDYEVIVKHEKALAYFIPSLLIQPVLENCLKHAVRDLQGGKIGLCFTLQHNHILCEIIDNGKGFTAETMQKDYQSKGIILIKNKISIVQNLTKQNIDFHYQNKLNSQGEILGTQTTFTFPLLTFDYDDKSVNN